MHQQGGNWQTRRQGDRRVLRVLAPTTSERTEHPFVRRLERLARSLVLAPVDGGIEWGRGWQPSTSGAVHTPRKEVIGWWSFPGGNVSSVL
mmetsp:Transcript_9215/g.27753  ORF Transcript_9215/g.27753 Transcript_9215/m.27753 type:complete len:91 (+) Transcript_9215:959-1231(+)